MLYRLLYILLFISLFSSCTGQEPRRPVQTHSGSFIKQSAERNKVIYDQEKEFIKDIIEKDSTRTYYSSEQGFWYYYNARDTTETITPKMGDVVQFTYDIRDFGDNTILSEEDNGLQHYKVDQSNQDLISGIREGIKLMKEGEEVTFLFPSYKAYGYYGIDRILGSNIPVQSTIRLHSIETEKESQED